MEADFVVVDKHAGGDVHGINQDDAFGDSAFFDGSNDIGSDVDKFPAQVGFNPDFIAICFHKFLLFYIGNILIYFKRLPANEIGAAGYKYNF